MPVPPRYRCNWMGLLACIAAMEATTRAAMACEMESPGPLDPERFDRMLDSFENYARKMEQILQAGCDSASPVARIGPDSIQTVPEQPSDAEDDSLSFVTAPNGIQVALTDGGHAAIARANPNIHGPGDILAAIQYLRSRLQGGCACGTTRPN